VVEIEHCWAYSPIPLVVGFIVCSPYSKGSTEFVIPVEWEHLFDCAFPESPSVGVWCSQVWPDQGACVCFVVLLFVGKLSLRAEALLSDIHSILFNNIHQHGYLEQDSDVVQGLILYLF